MIRHKIEEFFWIQVFENIYILTGCGLLLVDCYFIVKDNIIMCFSVQTMCQEIYNSQKKKVKVYL